MRESSTGGHCNCNLVYKKSVYDMTKGKVGRIQKSLKSRLLALLTHNASVLYQTVRLCMCLLLMSSCVCNFRRHLCLPQWHRGQQSWVSQRSSVPSGQDGVSIAEQLMLVAEMKTSSFTFTHWCNTHLSWGDCHTSPTYKPTQVKLKST